MDSYYTVLERGAPQMAFLLLPDKKQTKRVPLQKSIFFVGRARENDLIIPSESLSRFHAQIQKRGAQYVIHDRGSLNGVFINGKRIVHEEVLNDGDIIGFGDIHARFCTEETRPLGERRADETPSERMQRFPVTNLVDSSRYAPEKRQRYLELLYRFSTRLLQHSPSSDLGEVALDLIHEIWSPDRSCLMLRGSGDEWQITTQRLGKNTHLESESFDISRSLIRELEKSEEALLISHRIDDRRFSASESLQRQNVTSVLCAPLWNNKRIHGFLYADLTLSTRSFTYEDLEMFTILANLMAVKWENNELWRQALMQQQLEQELNLASEIQRKFFPTETPDIPEYDFGAITIPTRKVGGDAYFWHERKNGELVLMIADVMGKGLPSSLLMSQIQAIMKIFSEEYESASEIVRAVNEFIHHHSTQEKFISMVVVVLSPGTGTMSYCNAGHNAPFLLAADKPIEYLEKGGTLVGVFPDQPYEEGESTLSAESLLVFYTDGIVEARNEADEEFGVERLIELVQSHRTKTAKKLTEEIIHQIRELWLGTDQEDDWTLLVVKRG